MTRLKTVATFLIATRLSCPCSAQVKSPWEALGLKCAKLEKETLYYEKCLEPKLDFFRDSYKKFLAAEAQEINQRQELRNKSQEVLADVNRIVGGPVDEPRKSMQESLLETMLAPKFYSFNEVRDRLHLYLVRRETVKNYLRKGGTLPDFAYDKSTDTASYLFQRTFSTKKKEADRGRLSLFIIIKGPETAEKDLEEQFTAMGKAQTVLPGLIFHELTEMTILQWMRFYDPYFRWFSDGFANAITTRLLRKYVSEDAAKELVEGFDHSKYSDIEKEINLFWWMGLAFCVRTPLESEARLENARYAYATFEAQRLIEKHGTECVAKILDKACKERINNSRNLLPALKEVTAENIEKRFRRYQTFGTREEGLQKYAARFKAAIGREDYPEALSNLLRVEELNGGLSATNRSITAHLAIRP